MGPSSACEGFPPETGRIRSSLTRPRRPTIRVVVDEAMMKAQKERLFRRRFLADIYRLTHAGAKYVTWDIRSKGVARCSLPRTFRRAFDGGWISGGKGSAC